MAMTPESALTFAPAPFVQHKRSRTMNDSTVIATMGLTPDHFGVTAELLSGSR